MPASTAGAGLPPANADQSLPPAPEGLGALLAPFLTVQDAPGRGAYRRVSGEGLRLLAERRGLELRAAMALCLEHDIWPARFCRNRGLLSAGEQRRLLRSRVLVVGCGGLGGHVIELLARVGVGELALCDGDVFEESNLNRQRLCREDRLGMNKALAAADEVRLMASHVLAEACAAHADAAKLPSLLRNVQAAVDCLDGIASRKLLESAAHGEGIPFIHGAVAGLEGFALASLPQDGPVMRRLYPNDEASENDNAEKRLGVPTPTPAATAALQATLTVRCLLGALPGQGRAAAKAGAQGVALWRLDLSAPELEVFFV
jgi:molybdopterin/thiamine biosynthesis adenylyltransferase